VVDAGHELDLLLAGSDPDAQTAAAVHRVIRLPFTATRRPERRRDQRLLALRLAVRGGPSELYDNSGARAALEAGWPDETYDVVVIEHAGLAPLVKHRRTGEHWICTLQNIASGTASALRDLAPGRRQRLLVGREVQQAAGLERVAIEHNDSDVTVSPDDGQLLPGPSTVVPNGVDLVAFSPSPVPRTPTLLFTGTLSYLPNVDGLQWFCRVVFPLVQAQVPDVVFHVVGRDPTPQIRALADVPGIVLSADVPSVKPFLAASRVCVVPLRVGTGSRLKALEALASGRPLVGTTVGPAGLGLTDQAVTADDPSALADAIVTLLLDDARADQLAAAGRQYVEESFGWDSVARPLVEHLARVSPR
ncbi:MAG: glycosyltransferase, partial [Pseudorhodobacter sp.]|nr:glycosyltransferase [Frankiaceae bacterium]